MEQIGSLTRPGFVETGILDKKLNAAVALLRIHGSAELVSLVLKPLGMPPDLLSRASSNDMS